MNFFGVGKSETPSEDAPEIPAGDEGLNKSSSFDPASLPEDIFGDVSLETPGSVGDWNSADAHSRSILKSLLNPGKYSENERTAQTVLGKDDFFNCFRFEYNKQGTDLIVGHSISLGSSPESTNYSFMMQHFSPKNVLMGRIGTEGDFNGIAQRVLNKWVTARLVHQKGSGFESPSLLVAEVDCKGDDSTTSLKLQLHNTAPTVSVSYNQSVTPALSLGCEGILMAPGVSSTSAMFKYTNGKHVFSGQVTKQPLSPVAGHLTYLRRVDNRPGSQINYATQLKVSPNETGGYSTSWSAGWDYKIQLSSVKGIVDSDGKIYSAVEQRIYPFMSLVFSGVADLFEGTYAFGFGVQLQMQDLTEEQQKELERQVLAMQGGEADAIKGGEEDDFEIKKEKKKNFI